MNRGNTLVATAVVAMLASTSAFAQVSASDAASATAATPPENGGIEDIVVTAQRRRETVQSVPIAISAFSAEQLQRQGVSNALDLGNFVPNLIAQNNTGLGSANAYYLRGLGNTESVATFDPPVGTYIDDIYLSRQNANNLNLFDVERVEVLRGPQGTLFGRNTTGGAINVILREPGKELGGFAEIGYGSFRKKLARGSIDIPLAETFQIKVSGYYQNDRGYAKNITTGQRVNDDDGYGVRLGIHGDLAPWARWNASYAHIVANGENLLNFECNPANPSDCKGRFVSTGLIEKRHVATSLFLPNVISGKKANFGLGNYTGTDLVTSNLEFDVGAKMTLNLITGFVHQSQEYALDFSDGRSLPSLANPTPAVAGFARGGFVITNDGTNDQFSQEIKLGGSLFGGAVDFVTGAYYIREENSTDFADLFSISPTFQLLLADRLLKNTTNAIAGYGQADLNVTDKIKLTAGVRYTDEVKRFSIHDNRAICNTGGALPVTCLDNANLVASNGVRIPTKQTAKLWTPRFAANFKPIEDVLLFASATRGFKSGGWNARGTTPGSFLPFDPEKVWSYEAGLKSDFFDRRLRVNLTAFYIDMTAQQSPAALVSSTGAISFITRNFSNYRNKGLEAEITVVPVRGLNLYANAGYMDDHYKLPKNAPATDAYGVQSVAAQIAACRAQLAAGVIPTGTGSCGAGIVGPDGNIATPVRTPKFTLSMGGSYELPLGGSGLTLVPSANAYYRTKQEVGTANLSFFSGSITGSNGTFASNPNGGDFITGSFSRSVWLINGGLSLNGPENAWQLSVSCNNCFNESRVASSLANTTYLNPPMTWLGKLRYNF